MEGSTWAKIGFVLLVLGTFGVIVYLSTSGEDEKSRAVALAEDRIPKTQERVRDILGHERKHVGDGTSVGSDTGNPFYNPMHFTNPVCDCAWVQNTSDRTPFTLGMPGTDERHGVCFFKRGGDVIFGDLDPFNKVCHAVHDRRVVSATAFRFLSGTDCKIGWSKRTACGADSADIVLKSRSGTATGLCMQVPSSTQANSVTPKFGSVRFEEGKYYCTATDGLSTTRECAGFQYEGVGKSVCEVPPIF